MTIKAIETCYKGYRFRSRLEARWAVYFDAEGLAWEYEKEGYNLGPAGLYLPDFWLPQVSMWAEVKPEAFSELELDKAWALYDHTNHPVIFLVGLPDNCSYKFTDRWFDTDCERSYNDCVVSSYHGYPKDEKRFFTNTGEGDYESHLPTRSAYDFASSPESVIAARSARFEFGESG